MHAKSKFETTVLPVLQRLKQRREETIRRKNAEIDFLCESAGRGEMSIDELKRRIAIVERS